LLIRTSRVKPGCPSLPYSTALSSKRAETKGVEISTSPHTLPTNKGQLHPSPALLTVLQLSHTLSNPLSNKRKLNNISKRLVSLQIQASCLFTFYLSFQVTLMSLDKALNYLYKQVTLHLRPPFSLDLGQTPLHSDKASFKNCRECIRIHSYLPSIFSYPHLEHC